MKELDLNVINSLSPYAIWIQGGRYYFRTDYSIVYAISFDAETAFIADKAYWFNLSNTSNKKSPRDKKIERTVFVLLDNFFQENPDILLYICDTANNQQAQRDRLFLSWFNKYGQDKYAILTATINDNEQTDYVAMILPLNHIHFKEISQRFKDEIMMFKENK